MTVREQDNSIAVQRENIGGFLVGAAKTFSFEKWYKYPFVF